MAATTRKQPQPEHREDELYQVSLAELTLGDYNRVISDAHVATLIDAYKHRPWAVPPIECNLRESGRLVVINGQHRAEAARRLNWLTLKAVVHFGWTEEQEAQAFRASAQAKPIGSLDAWWAAHLAGDPEVLAIEAVVKRLGLHIPRYVTGNRDQGQIQCVGALRTIAYGRTHGSNQYQGHFDPSRVEAVLAFSLEAWAESRERFDGRLLRIVASFFRKYEAHPAFDRREAVRKLSVYDALDILRRSQTLAHMESIDIITAGVRVLTGLYDKARRGARLMPIEQSEVGE